MRRLVHALQPIGSRLHVTIQAFSTRSALYNERTRQGKAAHDFDDRPSRPCTGGAKTRLVVLLVMLSLALAGMFALRPPDEVVLDRAKRTQAIDTLVTELNQHYVLPIRQNG